MGSDLLAVIITCLPLCVEVPVVFAVRYQIPLTESSNGYC